MPCNTCGQAGAKTARARAAELFRAGRPRAARRLRWQYCSRGNSCRLACENLDKEAGLPPACVEAATHRVWAPDLYAALQRGDFHCPRERF